MLYYLGKRISKKFVQNKIKTPNFPTLSTEVGLFGVQVLFYWALTLVSTEFDAVVENKKERRKYIPPQSHPWKLASFKRYLHKLGKSMEDYQAEQTA